MSAKPSSSGSAEAALRELEIRLAAAPPPTTSQEDITGFFSRHRPQLVEALAHLIDKVRSSHVPETDLRPHQSRQTYPDGRWIAEPNDEVYTTTRGFGGTPASVRGRVEQGRSGSLRVRVTGSAGFFQLQTKAKTLPYSEQWTVVGDPRPDQIQLTRERERAEQNKKEEDEYQEYQEQGRKRAAGAVANGEQYLSQASPIGHVITDHLRSEVGVLVSRDPWTIVRWEFDYSTNRTFSKASNTATVGEPEPQSFLPQYRILRRRLWPNEAPHLDPSKSPSEEQARLLIELAKQLRTTIDQESRLAGFWQSPQALNKLASLIQQHLLQPKYLGLPGLVEKRLELLPELMGFQPISGSETPVPKVEAGRRDDDALTRHRIKTFSTVHVKSQARRITDRSLTTWSDGRYILIAAGEGEEGARRAGDLIAASDLPAIAKRQPLTGSFAELEAKAARGIHDQTFVYIARTPEDIAYVQK